MLRLLYTLVLTLVAPLFLYGLFKRKQGKPSVDGRWKEHFGITPDISRTKGQPVIWFHAVSVGEVIAVSPLVRRYANTNPSHTIVITTTTPTGAEQASKLADIAQHRYMPLDFAFAVRGFIKRVKPNKLMIVETELWPNTLVTVKHASIPITVINARLSERSCQNYAKVRPFFWLAAQHIDTLCCQFAEDAERFIRLGVDKSRVSVTGSVKFDITVDPDIKVQGDELRAMLGASRLVWIAASTHEGEDEKVLSAHQALRKVQPDALLVLVPRHPERFNQVERLSTEFGFSVERKSLTHQPVLSSTSVFLGDTMGEMMTYLAASDLCFMGGSLIGSKVGGHNILEPAALGVPCITGSSYFNFTQVVEQMLSANAIEVVSDEYHLAQTLESLIQNPQRADDLALSAKQVVNQSQGAINRTLEMMGS
ncbi:lipid IV(A) 3-deoxy-D-manno-octulosonic acid transferase [Vibrio sp. SCSIO 43140]|uniref:lipid IV(A) 3-deoxy-D-manno-octulosonic acid transferase n=1 Tax=Vibrio sp. SCSIO 43140 TaxID=2819100 RepID=UPI002075BD52|nr:lipid IV(A) 3-deoxy-D-manno-octulosonic acid transferase [Vibrio sp. SCSIO 43140]USD60303.1 lipid IV(A) 3-deoxy-D-manno-octulosonic acid transferase [Vibrio sp. SCSIO 43140]